MVLPKSTSSRAGLVAGICLTKSQSPRYSPGLEAWCINVCLFTLYLLHYICVILINARQIARKINLRMRQLLKLDYYGVMV